MRPVRQPSSSTAEAAAFALFEGLRQAQGLDVTRRGEFLLTFLRATDPASAGLAFTSAEDDGLQLRWGEVPPGFSENLWVSARSEEHQPYMALYLKREKPVLQVRFGGSAFVMNGEGSFELRERVTIPSRDGREAEREALVKRLAKTWKVPMEGNWLKIGRWDALEGEWEPDAVRRLVAIALILQAAHELTPDWLRV